MHSNGVVLIVDDEPAVARIIEHLLLLEGMRSETTHDPQTAIERIHRGGINLIIIDLVLNGDEQAGTNLYRKIRNLPEAPPAMFLTGFDQLASNYPGVPLIRKGSDLDHRHLVLTAQQLIRNRCRDTQLKEARDLSLLAVDQNREIIAMLRHPDEGLAATHRTAQNALLAATAANSRTLAQLITDTLKNPIIWGAVAIIGWLLNDQIVAYKSMRAEHHDMREAFIRLEGKVK